MFKKFSYTVLGTVVILQVAVGCNRKDPIPSVSKSENKSANTDKKAPVPSAPQAAKSISSQDEDAVVAAAKEGDVEKVRSLLQSGTDVNSKDSTGLSILGAALMTGKKEILELLLERKVDLTQKISITQGTSKKEVSVLELAITSKDIELIKNLILNGADVLNGDSVHGSFYFLALSSGAEADLEFEAALIGELLNSRANTEMISNTSGQTPLMTAIRTGRIALVKALTDGGAGIHFPNTSNKTPYDIAAEIVRGSNGAGETQQILDLISQLGGVPSDS